MSTPTPTNWEDLSHGERLAWAGNLDPWLGPVDPVAQERWLNRWRAQQAQPSRAEVEANTCGCWMPDCADCGARMADGQRPAKGQAASWWRRAFAVVDQAAR